MGSTTVTLNTVSDGSHGLTWIHEKLYLMPQKPQLEITASIARCDEEASLHCTATPPFDCVLCAFNYFAGSMFGLFDTRLGIIF